MNESIRANTFPKPALFCLAVLLAGPLAGWAAPPSNDQCAGAIIITEDNYLNTQSTTDATSDGDPTPTCVAGFGNGVWYEYTAGANGQLEVDTANSDYDTGLAAYIGGCGALTEVACNDDDLLNGVDTSRITMAATNGVTYWFLAGGSDEAAGNLVFHLSFVSQGPPLITTQPANQTVALGSNATFSVAASSLTPMTYAWKRNGGLISGANGSAYTLTNAQLGDSGSQFSCVVANESGSTPSASATLRVEQPVVLYHFDFESGMQGWTTNNHLNTASGYTNGLWHWSTGRANDPGHSPTHSLYYGQDETLTGGGNYDTGSFANTGAAVSPLLSFAGAPVTLSFSYFMDVEPPHGYPADEAYVEVSTNNGASYAILETKEDGLTNDTGGHWITNVVDMSAYTAANVLLRLRFDTVDSLFNDTEGWYVDDISITGLGNAPPPVSLYFESVAAVGAQILLTWNAPSGLGCQLQYKTNLSQPAWIDLGPPVTNAPMPFATPLGPDPARFYRLKTVH